MLAIGSFYDHRLEFQGINISIILSCLYSILVFYIFYSVDSFKLDFLNIIQYIFFFFAIFFGITLWVFYGVNDYGVMKLLDFILITVPISILIIQIFNRLDIKILLNILFGISLILLFVSLFNIGSLISSRTGVMGGGPIVLSRWLGLGALFVFFYNPLKKYRIFLFPIFIIVALLTGSRGPFYAIVLVMTFHLYLNFRRLFWRSVFTLSVIISLFFVSGIHERFFEIKTVSRVFMNVQTGGNNQSTEGRKVLIETSLDQIIEYPLGVGLGNWQKFADKKSFLVSHKPPLNYPHNIFLEIFCELGVFVGLLFFVYVITLFLKSLFYHIKNQNNKLLQLLFYIFAYLLFNAMISGDLSDSRLLFIFMSLLSIKELKNANNL
tara:strand:- start:41 stop:1180 length:1140 start_codon:yes stop_codon:yes gene_type:complete